MATYNCDRCGQTTADFMVTFIADGSVEAVGIECFEDWAMPIIEAFREMKARDQAVDDDDAGLAVDQPDDLDSTAPDAAADDASQAAAGPDAEWEADYPQGTKKGRRARLQPVSESVGEVTEAPTAADGEG